MIKRKEMKRKNLLRLRNSRNTQNWENMLIKVNSFECMHILQSIQFRIVYSGSLKFFSTARVMRFITTWYCWHSYTNKQTNNNKLIYQICWQQFIHFSHRYILTHCILDIDFSQHRYTFNGYQLFFSPRRTLCTHKLR